MCTLLFPDPVEPMTLQLLVGNIRHRERLYAAIKSVAKSFAGSLISSVSSGAIVEENNKLEKCDQDRCEGEGRL